MTIPLPRLPPPQRVYDALKPFSGIQAANMCNPLLVDLPPPWIGLLGYPSGIVDTLCIEHRTKRLAYYGKTIELSIVRRTDLDRALTTTNRRNTIPLMWRDDLDSFDTYRPKIDKVITNMTTATATKTTKAQAKAATREVNWLLSELKQSFTNANGTETSIGFMKVSPRFSLNWLKRNPHNRPVNWGQCSTLLDNWRSSDVKGKPAWIGEANLWVIDWNDEVADGQHRAISEVLAHGSEREIGELLIILHESPGTLFNLSEKALTDIKENGNASEHVPISGFQNWYTAEKKDFPTHGPVIYIPVVVNGNPAVAEKADQDQLARSGADQLARNTTSGSLIANFGQSPKLWQEVLRHIWLRAQPATISARKEGSKYSTLRKGGKPKADDYPRFMTLLKDSLTKAMELINELGTYNSPLSLPELIATVTLAVEGGYKEESIKNWLSYWAVSFEEKSQEYVEMYGPVWALKNLAQDTEDDRRKNRLYYVYAASYYLNAAERGEDPAPDEVHTIDKLLKVITKDPEQQPACRLNGLDSVGDMRFVSAALKKKLRIETKALTPEEREKIGLTEKDLPEELAKELLGEKKKGPKSKPPTKVKAKA